VRIGQIAQKTGVSVHTLRFYERKGLLPGVGRGASNYREFSSQSINRVEFIRDAQRLGFTLVEIRHLMDLQTARIDCETLRPLAERKVLDIEDRIRRLRVIKTTLNRLLRACSVTASCSCDVVRTVEALKP
jgi:DNA-binding transcriptional MerR regulator